MREHLNHKFIRESAKRGAVRRVQMDDDRHRESACVRFATDARCRAHTNADMLLYYYYYY